MNFTVISTFRTLCIAAAMLLAPRAFAGGCEDWRTGPLQNSQADNGTNGAVHALFSWDPDGNGPQFPRLVAGGQFTQIQGTTARNLASRNPSTGQWEAFGNPNFAPFNDCRALGVWNNQLVSGWGTEYPNGNTGGLRRWNGSAWTFMELGNCNPSFTNMTPDFVRCFGYYNGALYAGGGFTGWGDGQGPQGCGGQYGWGLSSWDGVSNWRRHVPNFGAYDDVLAMQAWNGLLVVGGTFAYGQCSCNPGNRIAAWDGANWNNLNGGTNDAVRAMTIFNGELIAAGDFTQMGFSTPVSASRIARWNGSVWQPLGQGLSGTVHALALYNGELIAAGEFLLAGGAPAARIARWNGSIWQPLGTGIDSTVWALAVHNGELIAGGDFTTAGGQPAFDLARWNGTQWASFGGGSATSVLAFANFGSRIVSGGGFQQSTTNGQTANNICAFDGVNIAPFGSGMNGPVRALTSFTYSGPTGDRELVAGGSFTNAGGVAANNIARWAEDPIGAFPPPAWEAMGSGFNNMVTAVTRYNGTTVAGGYFSASGATAVNSIARWNETTDTWGAMGSGMNGPVTALRGYSSSATNLRLVAGGLFSTAGGVGASNIAQWNESTVTPGTPAWAPMGTGFNGQVYAIEYHAGSLYAAGAFTHAGATLVNRIARWDTALNPDAWVPVGGGFNGVVSVLRSSNGFLYAGGDFTTADGATARRLARWNGSAWQEVQGGADDDVFALQSYHNELHTGGWFASVREGAIVTKSWARYFETGVPWIAYEPSDSSVTCNQHAYFYAVPAVGYGGLSFVWRKDGVALANGPTGTGSHILNRGPLLDILYPSQADEGVYDLVLSSDGCGSVTTFARTLDVIEACAPCPADATHDRMINVSDLLLIIGNWGACPPPPPVYTYAPPCLADLNGDTQINVTDLLAVIGAWGACP